MHSVRRHELGVKALASAEAQTMMHSVRRHELGAADSGISACCVWMHSVRRHELGAELVQPGWQDQEDAFRAET